MIALGMLDKHQDIEEPCEVKVSSTVLKTNGVGDNLVEFNQTKSNLNSGSPAYRSIVAFRRSLIF